MGWISYPIWSQSSVLLRLLRDTCNQRLHGAVKAYSSHNDNNGSLTSNSVSFGIKKPASMLAVYQSRSLACTAWRKSLRRPVVYVVFQELTYSNGLFAWTLRAACKDDVRSHNFSTRPSAQLARLSLRSTINTFLLQRAVMTHSHADYQARLDFIQHLLHERFSSKVKACLSPTYRLFKSAKR